MGFWNALFGIENVEAKLERLEFLKQQVERCLWVIYSTHLDQKKIQENLATEAVIANYDKFKFILSAEGIIQDRYGKIELSQDELYSLKQVYDNITEPFMQKIDELTNKLKGYIDDNFVNLQAKKYQLLYYDDYGQMIIDDWQKEVKYFITNVAFRFTKLDEAEYECLESYFDYYMDKLGIKYHKEHEKNQENSEEMFIENINTGEDYEVYISNLLKQSGFKVKHTPKTGDQGVDLIAIKNDTTIAIQCKFYSKPVGNKAVQEVIAGRGYYMCDYGCVVTNNTYTDSARKLASNQGILLLNEVNICENLEKLIE